ncbi:MAG: DNA topoisomerase 3 [Lachnospiraceae bacterium]|nr:DNA topoisomerase 3 [Lachnospiraceae bacterium]
MEYKLVIAEKPSVARSIASVIGAEERKDGYMEGNGYIVSWCIGHLVELAKPDAYFDEWKTWAYETLPIMPEKWKYEIKEETVAQYCVLEKLMHEKRVSGIVCATDAGREGELIFRLVYEMAECDKPIERLWISSMEEGAIRDGFDNLKPGSDYDNLYHSALCRQRADWLVGLNATRLFTVLYRGGILKAGRVQTPTLAMLADREDKIQNFKKEKYYAVHILTDGIDAVTEKIVDKKEAEKIAEDCRNKPAFITSVKKEKKSISPPKLYDLTTLQRDANRLLGFTAKQTLEYTQSLYEKKLVTYPGTDSRYLSDDMAQTAENVIKAVFDSGLLKREVVYSPDIKRVCNSKKVTDHHAVIPTVELGNIDLSVLQKAEYEVLALIAGRLLCATGNQHEYETVKTEILCEQYMFTTSGKCVLNNGWKVIEKLFRKPVERKEEQEDMEKELPEITEGQELKNVETKVSEQETKPPLRYTEDSLLSAMEHAGSEDMGDDVERKGLGTPATRADIIEKLVKDGYLKREKAAKGEKAACRLIPTEDGLRLIRVIPDMIKSPKLTAEWENALTLVSKGEIPMEHFMANITDMITELVRTHQEADAEKVKMFAPKQEVVGICPNCGSQIVKGKYGAYCEKKCGMTVNRAMGVTLIDGQIKDLLAGKKILLKELKSKTGKFYDAYIIPNGTEEYHYTKDGAEKSGVRFKFIVEFPKKKFTGRKKE